MTRTLRIPRTLALAAIAVLVAASALVSFAESYRGLFLWSHEHGLSGLWAAVWPLQVDVFVAVGELALFVALVDRWTARSRTAAWTVTVTGLAVSVAGNVGHVAGHSLTDRATAAVPPLAAAAALAVGLGVLKRVVGSHHVVVPEMVPGPVRPVVPRVAPKAAQRPAAGPSRRSGSRAMANATRRATEAYRASVGNGSPVSERQLSRDHGIGRKRAAAVAAQVRAEANGHRQDHVTDALTGQPGSWR